MAPKLLVAHPIQLRLNYKKPKLDFTIYMADWVPDLRLGKRNKPEAFWSGEMYWSNQN